MSVALFRIIMNHTKDMQRTAKWKMMENDVHFEVDFLHFCKKSCAVNRGQDAKVLHSGLESHPYRCPPGFWKLFMNLDWHIL